MTQGSDREVDINQLFQRAWEDKAFKEELLSNPRAVLEREGAKIPEGIEVNILEETPDTLYLTLPMKPTEELSDEELEAVAGGGLIRDLATTTVKAAVELWKTLW